jgi:predicted acylesterase/phospholipase RssA
VDVTDEWHGETSRNGRGSPAYSVDRETALGALGSLVGDASPELVEAVLGRVEWLNLASGSTLFGFGDPSDAAYLVLRGRLRVTIPSDGADGDETFVRDLGRGEIVGELGLINDEPRSATVRAVRETALARLAAADFLDLIGSHPGLALGVANAVLRRAVTKGTSGAGSVAVAAFGVGSEFVDGLAAAMAAHGPLERLSRRGVEARVAPPWITGGDDDGSGSERLATLLADAESSSGRLLLEADPSISAWTARALRSADLLVVAVRPEPSQDDDVAALRVVEARQDVPHLDTWLVVVHPPGLDRPVGTHRSRARYRADAVVHVREDVPADLERLGRLASGRGVGLVLGGGGARGFAHFGVYRALTELGVPIDHIGGSSMGAVLGAVISLDLGYEEMLEAAESQFRGIIDYTLPVVALAKGKRAGRQLTAMFGGWAFEDLWTPYFCVSTSLTRSVSVVHDSGDLVRALRASLSIPGVFPPTPIGDDLHVDAGVLDNLPVGVMRTRPGVGTVIAVDVAPPTGPRAKADYGLHVAGWSALRAGLGRRRSIYPRISAVLMRSMILASMRDRDRVVVSGDADLYLDLDLRGVGLLDFERVRPVADAGYEAALPRIRDWWRGAAAAGSSAPREAP